MTYFNFAGYFGKWLLLVEYINTMASSIKCHSSALHPTAKQTAQKAGPFWLQTVCITQCPWAFLGRSVQTLEWRKTWSERWLIVTMMTVTENTFQIFCTLFSTCRWCTKFVASSLQPSILQRVLSFKSALIVYSSVERKPNYLQLLASIFWHRY